MFKSSWLIVWLFAGIQWLRPKTIKKHSRAQHWFTVASVKLKHVPGVLATPKADEYLEHVGKVNTWSHRFKTDRTLHCQINDWQQTLNKVASTETHQTCWTWPSFLTNDQRYLFTMRFEPRVPDYVVCMMLILVMSLRYDCLAAEIKLVGMGRVANLVADTWIHKDSHWWVHVTLWTIPQMD